MACGLAGFAYGALLDLSVMVSYGGEQSLDRYLAISARGVAPSASRIRSGLVMNDTLKSITATTQSVETLQAISERISQVVRGYQL